MSKMTHDEMIAVIEAHWGLRYLTREGADKKEFPGRLACIRIEYTDGQFDD